jgi:hypothetical protein
MIRAAVRQAEAEGRPASRLGPGENAAAMILDNALADREPQAGAVRLAVRREWLEEARSDFG